MPGAEVPRAVFSMISSLTITLGYRCNFNCAHCIVAGQKNTALSEKERELIAASAVKHKVRHILFVGGEPTLYIRDMNDIISRLGGRKTEIRMTTNGHFASSEDSAVKVLSSIPGLSGLNLSCDRLHEKFLPEANIEYLFLACKRLGLDFAVVMALLSPLDLLMLKKLRAIGRFPVLPQRLLPLGAAKSNNLAYKFPSFDKEVLSKFCPSRKKLIYLCGEGFSSCCSPMAFESGCGRFIHPTAAEHLDSEFYKLLSAFTFGDMIKKLGLSGLEMLPADSAPCVLCEKLFRSKYGAAL